MSSGKKYQVFISSTYTDLREERQAAVEAILKAGHIPAGMELFTSTNKSQWEVIKRWIEESDIYMLILGGRYGSMESESGKSYTHLEYEYALEKNKPLFSVVIKEDALKRKTYEQVETNNPKQLEEFKNQVESLMCSYFNSNAEVKLAVHESLGTLIQDNELIGWVRGNQQNEGLTSELVRLNEENRKLREENEEFKRNQQIRLPKLTLEINDGEPLILKYKEYKALFYKNREPIEWSTIDDELKEFLSIDSVEKFNQELSEITDEKIEEFNRATNLKAILEQGVEIIKFRVANVGTLKANQMYISIQFPNFIYVEEREETRDKLDLIKDIENKLFNIIPNPTWNPLREANEKLQKAKLKKMDPWSSVGIPNIGLARTFGKAYALQPTTSDRLINFKRINNSSGNYDYLKDNCIIIKRGNLLHTLSNEYDDYCIYPLDRGKGQIIITLHCEEYSTEEIIEIPIIVE